MNAKNRYEDTPLDVASDPAIKALLVNAGASHSPARKNEVPAVAATGPRLHNAATPRLQYVNNAPHERQAEPTLRKTIAPVERAAPVVNKGSARQKSSAFGKGKHGVCSTTFTPRSSVGAP